MPVGRHEDAERQSVNPAARGVAGFGSGPRGRRSAAQNAQIANKGITSRNRLAYEYFLNPFMGVGGEAFGYHYFIDGQRAANSQDHSSGYHRGARELHLPPRF